MPLEFGIEVACPTAICCPNRSTGSWSCAPSGSACCHSGADKLDSLGLYCDSKAVCVDKQHCADDKGRTTTFPAIPGASPVDVPVTSGLRAGKSVYDWPVSTVTPGGGSGSVTTTTGTAAGGTATGKPNGAVGGYHCAGPGGVRAAVVGAGVLWAVWGGL